MNEAFSNNYMAIIYFLKYKYSYQINIIDNMGTNIEKHLTFQQLRRNPFNTSKKLHRLEISIKHNPQINYLFLYLES